MPYTWRLATACFLFAPSFLLPSFLPSFLHPFSFSLAPSASSPAFLGSFAQHLPFCPSRILSTASFCCSSPRSSSRSRPSRPPRPRLPIILLDNIPVRDISSPVSCVSFQIRPLQPSCLGGLNERLYRISSRWHLLDSLDDFFFFPTHLFFDLRLYTLRTSTAPAAAFSLCC